MRKAHAQCRRAKEFGHDGADQRQRRIDLQRIEQKRHRRWQPERKQGLEPGGAIAVHQVVLGASGGGQARDSVDQHRKEGHHHHDRGLRLPIEPEPHHEDRRDADDREGRDKVADRKQAAAQEIVAVAGKRCGEAGRRTDQPARKCGANEGLDEVRAKLRQGRQQLVQDQRGCRQQHARHVEADARDFPQEHQREPEHQRYALAGLASEHVRQRPGSAPEDVRVPQRGPSDGDCYR